MKKVPVALENKALTRDDSVVLDGAPHDHDGVMERPLCLFEELFSSTSQNDGTRFGVFTTLENVKPIEKKINK